MFKKLYLGIESSSIKKSWSNLKFNEIPFANGGQKSLRSRKLLWSFVKICKDLNNSLDLINKSSARLGHGTSRYLWSTAN